MPIADVTIRFLEATRESFSPKRAARNDLVFAKVDPPAPELNRHMYFAVGGPHFWLERRSWSPEQWKMHFADQGRVETWLLSAGGIPAGYVELEPRPDNAVEIKYFGLLPAFVDKGIGGHLLTCAMERAFAMGAQTIKLDTCDLDHPHAIRNYLARGFREVKVVVKQKELPEVAPDAFPDADDFQGGRALLRHTIAVVAYRGGKALRGAPESFASFKVGPESRTPLQILAHINDLYDWALALANGEHKWRDSTPGSWDAEVARFFEGLQAFESHLASEGPLQWSAERLFAGPIADSLTHIGQLTMLRRLAGSPIKGENYAKADIATGRVGENQAPPRVEFN